MSQSANYAITFKDSVEITHKTGIRGVSPPVFVVRQYVYTCKLLEDRDVLAIVEAIKKMTGNEKHTYNIMAAIVSVIVAGAVSAAYLIMTGVRPDAKIWVIIIALVLGSWLCAMLSYDKVKQAILQIRGDRSE